MKFHIPEELRFDDSWIKEIEKKYAGLPIEIRSDGWVTVDTETDKSAEIKGSIETKKSTIDFSRIKC